MNIFELLERHGWEVLDAEDSGNRVVEAAADLAEFSAEVLSPDGKMYTILLIPVAG